MLFHWITIASRILPGIAVVAVAVLGQWLRAKSNVRDLGDGGIRTLFGTKDGTPNATRRRNRFAGPGCGLHPASAGCHLALSIQEVACR